MTVDHSWTNKTLPSELVRRSSGTQSRAVAQLRSSLTTTHHPSFVQLYYAIEARRTSSSESMVVQFVSPSPGAGVSTVASGYARVAASGRSSPVLFVDASCRPSKNDAAGTDAPTLIEAFECDIGLADAIVPARNADNLQWARLCRDSDELLAAGSGRLQDLVNLLSARHHLVVFDSASIERPEAAALSRYCDGTLLVLEAGVTSQLQVDAACKRIRQFGGLPIGLVLNRERRALGGKSVQFA
jgi:Mrp family chromosome partitioning ATPase